MKIFVIVLILLPVALSQESEESLRIKRSGFSLIGNTIQNLQKSAFSASAGLSSGSANSIAGLSGSSSGPSSGHPSSGHPSSGHTSGRTPGHTLGRTPGHTSGRTPGHTSSGLSFNHDIPSLNSHSFSSSNDDTSEPHQDTKSFDGWQLKSSILNTLLQAVKAIAGGLTSVGGQLIRGSGFLVQQKGKLIQTGGDVVSNAGRNIIESSHLVKTESSGSGGNSVGHSLGAAFSGLSSGITSGITKTLSGLSAGSSSSSSGSSSSGSSSSGLSHSSHDDGYSSDDGPSYLHKIPESNDYASYSSKPAGHENYGPPKTSSLSYLEPHSAYNTPDYNDGQYKSTSNQEADDVLSDILKNIPHKPMKSIEHGYSSDGQNFNQIPILDEDSLPPFRPLKDYPSTYDMEFESHKISNEYGQPGHYDISGQSSDPEPTAVDPKAYNIYHTMKIKVAKENSSPKQIFATKKRQSINQQPKGFENGVEIQKSIEYVIKS